MRYGERRKSREQCDRDLASVTAELASVFRSAVEKAGLKLVVDCPPLAAPAYIDREMWEKIVLNLLSNAFKFTFEGEIGVSLRKTDEYFELAVRDSGTGIPLYELPKLFERFHRVAGAQGRMHEGSGIGLALVHELVKLHGGTVSAESEYGKGSAFKVTIPVGRTHLPVAASVGSAKEALDVIVLRLRAFPAGRMAWREPWPRGTRAAEPPGRIR
jgi:signal transduction histidine kinase